MLLCPYGPMPAGMGRQARQAMTHEYEKASAKAYKNPRPQTGAKAHKNPRPYCACMPADRHGRQALSRAICQETQRATCSHSWSKEQRVTESHLQSILDFYSIVNTVNE